MLKQINSVGVAFRGSLGSVDPLPPPPVNQPPVATDDTINVDFETVFNSNVLSNDSDPDVGDTLTVVGFTQGSRGTVSIASNGDLTYTPGTDESGADSFTYTIEAPDGRDG